MKINFPNISEHSNFAQLFAKLQVSPKKFVSTEEDPIKSVDIDEGEHYLACFEHGIRKIGILPADTQILLKRDLNTSVPWLIKGMAGKLLTRKILVIEEPFQLKPKVGELAIYLGILNDKKEFPRFAKHTKVLTETKDGSLAMAAKVVTDQLYNRDSETVILKGSATTDKIITLNTPLKRTLADIAIDVIITRCHDALAYKDELTQWLPNHPLIAYMEQLATLTAEIPDYKPLDDETNSKTNQQKRAIVNYIERIKQPLINLLFEHYHLRFIEAHTPEEDIQEAIDYYQSTTTNPVLDLVQVDQEFLKPHGIETFLDIHAFFKTPLMNMNKRNNFKHKIRTPEEADNFTKLANLSIDLVYEISRFIEFEEIQIDS